MQRLLSFLMLLLVLFPLSAYSFVGLCCAKCGGNMPMNIPGAGVPETKEFRFKISPMLMRMDGLLDGTNSIDGDSLLGMSNMGKSMAVPTDMNMTMLNFSAGYSFTDDFFGGIMFMKKKNEMDMKFSSMMQTMTGKTGFTMESEGMGDTMIMTKYRLFTDNPLVPTKQASLFLGLSIPTGSIEQKNGNHPLTMRQTEQLPYSMQLGSGTYDPTVGIVMQKSASPYWYGANFMYTGRLNKNSRDYALGNELTYDLYFMKQLSYNFLAHVQLNGKQWGKIQGEMDEAVTGASGRSTKNNGSSTYMTPLWDTSNYGGHKVFATFGLQWQPKPLHIIEFNVGIPIYQNLNGPQLKETQRIFLTYYVEIPTSSSRRYLKNKNGKSRLGF